MAKKVQKEEERHSWCCCGSGGSLFWGIFLLLIGLWFLARDLGYISSSVSMWPVVLIFIALWMLLKPRRRIC